MPEKLANGYWMTREEAWERANSTFSDTQVEDKIIQAIAYLYGFPKDTLIQFDNTQTIDRYNYLNKRRFLDGQFIIRPQGDGQYLVTSNRNWNVRAVVSGTPVIYTSLYPLYQAALNEVTSKQYRTGATLEAERTLEKCLNLHNTQVPAFIMERKERVAALMLQDIFAADFPAMNQFWHEYEKIYQTDAPTHFPLEIASKPSPITPIEDDDFTTAFQEFKKIVRQRAAIAQDDPIEMIEQNAKQKKAQVAIELFIKEYEESVSPIKGNDQKLQIKAFLKNRKNTDKDVGYTSNPNAPENLFCARLALSLCDDTKHWRKQFWQLLYPDVENVFLDLAWPEFGEALLCKSNPTLLINYRKVALMSQHADARGVIMGEMLPENACDKILVEYLEKHPCYTPLSQADQNNIQKFNPIDADFWLIQSRLGREIKKIIGKEIPNFLIFFRELLEVYTRFGVKAIAGKGRRVGNRSEYEQVRQNSVVLDEMLKALSPFLQVFALTAFKIRLEQVRDEFAPNTKHYKSMQYLLERDTMTMESIGACFNQQYVDNSNIVGDPIHPEPDQPKGQPEIITKLENIKLSSVAFSVWGANIANGHDDRPFLNQDHIFEDIILKVEVPSVLLSLHHRINCIPDNVLAKQFLALTDALPMLDLWNVLATQLPHVTFVQLLFPKGIPENILNTTADCRAGVRLYEAYPQLVNKDTLIEKTIKTLKARIRTDLRRHQNNESTAINSFDEIIPLIKLLIENRYKSDFSNIMFLKRIILPSGSEDLTLFLSAFSGDHFEQILMLFQRQLKLTMTQTVFLEPIFLYFNTDATRQEILLHFFFDIIKEKNITKLNNNFGSFIETLEPTVCATLIMKLANEVAPLGLTAYLGEILSHINDTNDLAHILLILQQTSINNAAANPANSDFFDIRLDKLLAIKNGFVNLIAPLNKDQQEIIYQIIVPTLDDFVKIMNAHPEHQMIFIANNHLKSLMVTLEGYISVLNTFTEEFGLNHIDKCILPTRFIKTIADYIKVIQGITNEMVLTACLSNFKSNDFINDIAKDCNAFENLDTPIFLKVTRLLETPSITKENYKFYFSQADTVSMMVEKMLTLKTLEERIKYISLRGIAKLPATAENITALLTPITEDSFYYDILSQNMVNVFPKKEMPKTPQTLMTISKLPDLQFIMVLKSLDLYPEVISERSGLKLIFEDVNQFVIKLKSPLSKKSRSRLLAYADFPKLLQAPNAWKLLSQALQGEEYTVFLKKYPIPEVKTADELCAQLENLDVKKCKILLTHIASPMKNIGDWKFVFQKLNAEKATAVAGQFGVDMRTVQSLAQILDWTPQGEESVEIEKLTGILNHYPPFHAKLVKEFSGNPNRQRQLIVTMFSYAYAKKKMGVRQEITSFTIFHNSFNIFLDETIENSKPMSSQDIALSTITKENKDNNEIKKWRKIALKTVIKNNIKNVETLYIFVSHCTPSEVREVFQMVREEIPTINLEPLCDTAGFKTLSPTRKMLMAEALKQNHRLYTQALNQLMQRTFNTNDLNRIEEIVTPYQQAGFFSNKSKISIAFARVLHTFIQDMEERTFTQEDKVKLYALMAPYMENKRYYINVVREPRTLYINLHIYYLRLKNDLGFTEKNTSSIYDLCLAVNAGGLQQYSIEFITALNGGTTSATVLSSYASTDIPLTIQDANLVIASAVWQSKLKTLI